MNIAAIIVGIDGWEQYTLPLVESIWKHEPECLVMVVDNASNPPYPSFSRRSNAVVAGTDRLCYSAAINEGKSLIGDADWYIVLSNDVLCTGPFAHILAAYGDGDLVGPLMKDELGFPYLEGWCVCVHGAAWAPWDERFLGSDYEDVAYSTAARQRGFGLVEDRELPFKHLDQRQRYSIVSDFAGKNAHNRELFLREYAAVRV
jgi:hypothetical protein